MLPCAPPAASIPGRTVAVKTTQNDAKRRGQSNCSDPFRGVRTIALTPSELFSASACRDVRSARQLRDQRTQCRLPYEWLARKVLPLQRAELGDVVVRDEALQPERAGNEGRSLCEQPLSADANRAAIAAHQHAGELHHRDRFLEGRQPRDAD